MHQPLFVYLSAAVLSLLAGCSQVRHQTQPRFGALTDADVGAAPALPTSTPLTFANGPLTFASGQSPERDDSNRRRNDKQQFDEPGRPYSSTRARLQLFREDIEIDDIDIDFDNGSNGNLYNVDRTRTGFRAEFGRIASGGFFQLFSEKMRAPALFTEQFTNYGFGGGVVGAPTVGRTRDVEFLVPYRFEANIVIGSERVAGFNQDLWYAESTFELGFGARFLGVQSSSGIMVNSLAGLFDSDNPGNPAIDGNAELSGTNLGAYFEVLYKHPRVPLMAKVRGIVGDIRGVMLSFGFAF